MALANVLSAVKTLVLDAGKIPDTPAQRDEQYRDWFPDLSSEEREDLAKIPAEKLGIYTATIFTGESSIVKNHFKITLLRLVPAFEEACGESFVYSKFTRRVHATRPWKSHETLAFVHSVRDAVCFDMPELIEQAPELYDLAHMEALGIEIKRLPDEARRPSAITIESLESLTIAELLALSAEVSRTTRTRSASYPVFDVFIEFHRDKKEPRFPLNKQASFGVASRTQNNILRWKTVPEDALKVIETNEMFPIEVLANVYAGLDTEASEEELFQLFMRDLVALVKNGALHLHKAI